MSQDTCRRSNCTNPTGQQDRDDYNQRRYCSVQCETKHEHIKADARDAHRDAERHHDDAPKHDRGGNRL